MALPHVVRLERRFTELFTFGVREDCRQFSGHRSKYMEPLLMEDVSEPRSAKDLPEDFVNLFEGDQSVSRGPYPFYEVARQAGPITREPHLGVYLVTSYADIREIKRRHEDFSASIAGLGPHAQGDVPERPDFSHCPFGKADLKEELDQWRKETKLHLAPVLTLDPPAHTEFRNILNRLFTANRKEDLATRFQINATELIDAFVAHGEVEWVSAYSTPFTYFAINEALDIPRDDQQAQRSRFFELQRLRNTLVRNGTVPQLDETDPLAISEKRWRRYLTERRDNPSGDLLSQLASAPLASGAFPTIEELIGIANIMFVAGQDTSRDLISNAMLMLATKPELQFRLREHPAEIDNFVAEVLRFDPPTHGLFRYCVRDTVVNGTRIPAGAVLWLLYAAANRDPAVFKDPGTFDPARTGAVKALTFGYGHHFCPGQSVAKLEAQITFREALSRMKNIRLKDDQTNIDYRTWFVEHGPTHLDIIFDQA